MPDDAPSMRLAGSPPNGPALAIKATGDSWSASELVYQARALKQVYQRTWRLEDVEAQIHLYHRALELICGCNGLERLSFGGNSRQTIHILPFDIRFTTKANAAWDKHFFSGLEKIVVVLQDNPGLRSSVFTVTLTLHNLEKEHGAAQPKELLSSSNNQDARDITLLHSCCINLAQAYHDRYRHVNSAENAELQLQYATYALALLPGQTWTPSVGLRIIGSALLARNQLLEDPADLESALSAHRQALRMINPSSCDHDVFLTEFGVCLHEAYLRLGSLDTLTESINLLLEALDLTPLGHLNRHRVAYELARAYASRYDRLGKQKDRDESSRLYEEAAETCPPGHRDKHLSVRSRGFLHFTKFHSTGKLDDLELAIRHYLESLELCPLSLTARSAICSNLSNLFLIRFSEGGGERDLNEAVRMGREAVRIEPKSGAALTNLGNAVTTRFSQFGDARDLEETIRLRRDILQICRPGHPRRDLAANNLAGDLMVRFRDSFNFSDLEEAILLLQEALELRQFGHVEWGSTVFSLTEALSLRYTQTDQLDDLQEAIRLHADWLDRRTTQDSVWRGHIFLDTMADLRRLRYERLGDVQDLNEAIRGHEEARCIRPESYSEQHRLLSSLAIAYRHRAELTNSEADARRAMELHKEASTRVSPGHRDRARILLGLSRLNLVEVASEHNPKMALDLYCEGIADTHCAAQIRLTEGLKVLDVFEQVFRKVAPDNSLQSKLLHAYRLTVHLLPEVAYFGLDIHSRFKVLANAPELAANAAAQAMLMFNAESAVEILEEGRAVFWAQYLRLRSSFYRLPTELADKLAKTSRLLESGAIQVPAPARADNVLLIASEEELSGRRRLSEEFIALIQQARSFPGFERFMLNDVFSSLSSAAQTAPVVILLATPAFCGAILIRNPSAHAEQLCLSPGMKAERLKGLYKMLRVSNSHSRGSVDGRAMMKISSVRVKHKGIFEEIWHKIVKPILQFLGWKTREGRERPRLMICPTGPFTHLPIHAAGTNDEHCSDYFVPSYTPTLGALLAGRQQYKPIRRRDVRLLLAAVPKPFKWALLPYAVEEIERIKNVVPAHQVTSIPPNASLDLSESGSATSADVLCNLPGATILHLACHGHHDVANALNSGFVMRDRMLTVTELMKLNIPNAFFAFLSACETAKSAEAQPDQAIHLAATMLFAGFKSVIGTMWSMGDVDGPEVAKRVYEEIFGGDSEYIDPDNIPYALDAAVGELRQRKIHPSRWAPYIHLGI